MCRVHVRRFIIIFSPRLPCSHEDQMAQLVKTVLSSVSIFIKSVTEAKAAQLIQRLRRTESEPNTVVLCEISQHMSRITASLKLILGYRCFVGCQIQTDTWDEMSDM